MNRLNKVKYFAMELHQEKIKNLIDYHLLYHFDLLIEAFSYYLLVIWKKIIIKLYHLLIKGWKK